MRNGFVKKNTGKRVLIVALITILIGNSIQLPANAMEAAVESTVSDNDILSVELHIGQTMDLDELPDLEDSDEEYDMPIVLTQSAAVRLFVNQSMMDAIKEEDKYILTWSILRGGRGMTPGTANLVNQEDDWAGFETVSSSPYFTMQEDEDENSSFYKTLTITANEVEIDDYYDYYIRAELRYWDEQEEYGTDCNAKWISITTVPVTVAAVEEAEEEEETATTEEEEEPTMPNDTEEPATEPETSGMEASGMEEPDTEVEQSEEETESITDFTDENADETVEPAMETDAISISKIVLNRTNATMNPGDTLRLSVTTVPEIENPNITWTNSNPDIADIDDKGNITALAEGYDEITAECDGKKAVITINVAKTDADINGDQPKDKDGNIIAISDEVWVAGFEQESDDFIYTGSKITQNLRVYHKGTLLKEKTDYTLTYRNNVNAAAFNDAKAPSVTITMRGQYSGSRRLYFTIRPRELDENDSLGYEQVVQYAKTIKVPAPTVYFGSKKLVSGKDFVCDYSSLPENYTKGDSYEDGTVYEYTVNGIGNFTGSFTMKLAVIREKNLNLGTATVTFDKKQYEYHGEALTTSDVFITSVKLGKEILDESLYEYKVYAEGTGTGYVEVYPSDEGRNNGYRGRKKLSIKVVGDRNIRDTVLGNDWQDTITFSQKELLENGGFCQEKTGVLTFCEANTVVPLTEGIDYSIKYSNNKKVGTATVTFTGLGRYTGSFKKTYKILPKTELTIKWHDTDENGIPVVSYRKDGAVPRFELTEVSQDDGVYILNPKTDYTITVMNNKKLGMMTCKISGKGNYKGYENITDVKVISADISRGTMIVSDKKYSSKTTAWKSAVTIKDVNGKKLVAGTDYDRKLIYRYAGMEEGIPPQANTIVYVTAVGIHNYEGSSITGSYRIYDTSISNLIITIDTQEYTGREIELSADDIHVYANKKDAKEGKEIESPCYEILQYREHIKVGTAKVTLRGIGDYGGTRTCSFKISKKKYLTTSVNKITLDESSFFLSVGNSRQLTATIMPEDAYNKTIIWSTSNSKVATVSRDGLVTAKKPGKVTISALAQDTGKKAQCTVKVDIVPITSFSLNTTEIRQQEGTQYELKAIDVQPENASYTLIQWESTNPEIASVDSNGMVSLKKAGMAVIKAIVDEGRLVEKCLVFVTSNEETSPEGTYLTPQMFRTCEEEDDTKAFNEAIKNLNSDCNTVYVPAGTYRIDATTGILFANNMNFIMSPDAVLQAIDNADKSYEILYVKNVENVTISGGQIVGERHGHGGKTGEWGMGIGIYDSTDIRVTDVDISDCWGDGIYIGSEHETDFINGYDVGCRRIEIINCNVHNNRRNNLSIVCGDDVTVDGCTFNGANGTAPEYGIDIETNVAVNPCERITISNSTFEGNAQASMGIITAANDVNIIDCTMNGMFVNYAGKNVTLTNTTVNGEMDARIGVLLKDGTKINDGSSEEDLLVASFDATKDTSTYTLGEYGIDSSNVILHDIIDDSDSPSGKALYFKRETQGTKEAGYYLNLRDLTDGTTPALERNVTYRFEYVVKGSGQWGIKSNQTGWYPCVPMSDKFSTGYMTYRAGFGENCRIMLYAVDMTKDMELEIASIKIYEVR